MQTTLGIAIHFLFLSIASGGFFVASNLVSPIKAVVNHTQSHIPRMSIRLSEFSPAFSALEDDYYVGDFEFETIPENIPATELKAGTVEVMPAPKPVIEIPAMTMDPSQVLGQQVIPPRGWKQASQQNIEAQQEQPQLKTTPQTQTGAALIAAMNFPHHWVHGKIELVDGLAFTDPRDQLRIGWFVEGRKMRDARVRYQEGLYEIKVDRLEGELIAELVDRRGYILGEQIIDLELLARQRGPQPLIVAGVDLKLKPYLFGAKGQTFAVYHTDKNSAYLANVDVRVGDHDLHLPSNTKGRYHDESVSPQSSALLAANVAHHRESLALADFSKEQMIRLFPETFLSRFFDLIELDDKFRDLGVIWGTINKDGNPMAGYKIRIVDRADVPVVYFSYYIPDDKRTETSTDGQYAIVGLTDGEYEVEVINDKGQKVDSKLVAARAGSVSPVEFDLSDKKILYVKPFDPLSQNPKNVELAAMGVERVYKARTENIVKVPAAKGTDPLLVYAKPEGASIESTTLASRTRKFQEIPVLNTEWWQRIQKEYKISTQAGVVVGFLDTEVPFEVFNENVSRETKIIYFDHSGRIVTNSANRAGFILYGAGHGLKTIVISLENGLLATEAALVDGESVSVFYKSL